MAAAGNINDVPDGHVVLDLQCFDWVYLNGCVPKQQVAGQVVTFRTEHLGSSILSPVPFKQIGDSGTLSVISSKQMAVPHST